MVDIVIIRFSRQQIPLSVDNIVKLKARPEAFPRDGLLTLFVTVIENLTNKLKIDELRGM